MKNRRWSVWATVGLALVAWVCALLMLPKASVTMSRSPASDAVDRPAKSVAAARPAPAAARPANLGLLSPPAASLPVAATSATASASALPPGGRVILNDAGADRPFVVATDELVRRLPSGAEKSLAFARSRDLPALRETWTALRRESPGDVFPVAYEEGAERTLQTRRLVTPAIRVELQPGEDLAGPIPGAVEVIRPDYAPGFLVVRMADSFAALEALAAVRALGGVRQADVLLARQQTRRTLPNDPLVTSQWHLKNTGQGGGVAGTDIHVEPVWNYGGAGYRGLGLTVGVVDDGLETAHPDLAANVRVDIDHDWNDATADDPNPAAGDGNDHGTSCAGNVAAVGHNSLGVCGSAPEAKVVGLRLIAGSVGDQQEAEAMAWRNDVIAIKSNSWGPSDTGLVLAGPGSLTKAALKNAAETGRGGLGTIFLWAGGNGLAGKDNSNYDGYANSLYTLAVGALTNTRQQASYSEPGANLVVTSPSSGGTLAITTIDRTGTSGYNTSAGAAGNYASDFGGTSSATPTAAGVVALLLQRNPNLGWRDVREILIKTASKVNPADPDWTTNAAGYHFNHKFGAGLIDAAAAVAEAATWTNLGAPATAVATSPAGSAGIPNNDAAGVTRTFDLGATNLRVEQVTVRLTINHPARGNLAITLTSPSGVASRLAEVHADSGDNFTDWTFMTVRNWGENSAGTWTLKVADLSNTDSGVGTLTASQLTVFGAAATPVNPAPVVRMTSPQDQGSYSLGAAIPLAATASDLALGGGAGVVSKVEFLSGDAVLGTLAAPPYTLNWTPPAAGSYTLRARATDSEGAVGLSGTVAITVANLPPAISAAAVAPASPAFADQALAVTGVTASDPEGAAVSLAYQWQSSTDGVNFSNAAGQTAATAPAAAANAGRVWRCVITPSDGVNTGAAFTTAPLMVITRPAASVTAGQAYAYASDLVLRGTATTFTRPALLNEFSQGTGTAEWVEILTLSAGSFRQWKFDDSTPDAGTLVTFANTAVWDDIPAGTRIVIYNGASKDPQLPADDANFSDGKVVLASTNATYFTGTWPGLGNSGDALLLKNAAGATVHQLGYGNNTTAPPNIGGVGSATGAAFTGDTEAAAATAAGWRTHSATTAGSPTLPGVTPGEGNTTINAAFVSNLRSGFFSQPALFRLGTGAQLPAGLTLSSSGLLGGTVTGPAGGYPIVIERYNGLGETISFAFTLTVVANTPDFAAWIAGYAVGDPAPAADPDGDGRPNLLEYFQALDPSQSDGAAALSVEVAGSDLVLHYRKSKALAGVAEQVQWSEDLEHWSSNGLTLDPDQDLGTHLLRAARKPVGPGPQLFLRLVVTQVP